MKIDVPDLAKTLRMLVNCYKHDPLVRPDAELLEQVGVSLEPSERLVKRYAPLPESRLFLEGLAMSLGLSRDSDASSSS